MIPIEDMKGCIQEWFAQEYTLDGVSRLYFELRYEIEKQLEYMLQSIGKNMHDDGVWNEVQDG